MSVYLTNRVPGDLQVPLKPTEPIYFGMKSDTKLVLLSSLAARMGLTNLAWKPNTDPRIDLTPRADVSLFAPERRQPVDGVMGLTFGPELTIDSSGATSSAGVFEVSYEVGDKASILGHVAIPLYPSSWARVGPTYFCNLDSVVNFYCGLELGTRNTGIFVFLRDDNDTGTLVVGGPLQEYDTARPGQGEFSIGWLSKLEGTLLHIFLMADWDELSVRVWRMFEDDVAPSLVATVPFSDLGVFPPSGSGLSNSRTSQSNYARLFFGNPGAAEEALTVADFALYPDFRRSVVEGMSQDDHTLVVQPDCPVLYRADRSSFPSNSRPGRWLPLGATPVEDFYFQPGRKSAPLYSKLRRDGSGVSGFFKTEPRISQRADGFMLEGFVGGILEGVRDGHSTGMGLSVDDGEKLFELAMLDTESSKTWALRVGDDAKVSTSYATPEQDADYRGLRFVRLAVDRNAGVASMFVDDLNTPVVARPLSSSFPASANPGRVAMGRLQDVDTRTEFDVCILNYVPRYKAWEASDNRSPDDGGLGTAQFTKMGSEQSVLSNGQLVLTTPSFGVSGVPLFFTCGESDLGETSGVMVDFRAQVSGYTDAAGTKNPYTQWTGAGVDVHLGTRLLRVGLYNCGVHGQKVAVLPAGGESEILNQTETGKRYSASVDWFGMHSYRVVLRAFDVLEVYVDSLIDRPVISIPWAEINLPHEASAPGVSFGHLKAELGGSSTWEFVRWGISNGYEAALTQNYPAGIRDFLFAGRFLSIVEFEEVDTGL